MTFNDIKNPTAFPKEEDLSPSTGLLTTNIPDPYESNDDDDEATKDGKRKERLEQNRISARESRKRKKNMIEELQRTVITLSRDNKELNERNEGLRRELVEIGTKNPGVVNIQALMSCSGGGAVSDTVAPPATIIPGGDEGGTITASIGSLLMDAGAVLPPPAAVELALTSEAQPVDLSLVTSIPAIPQQLQQQQATQNPVLQHQQQQQQAAAAAAVQQQQQQQSAQQAQQQAAAVAAMNQINPQQLAMMQQMMALQQAGMMPQMMGMPGMMGMAAPQPAAAAAAAAVVGQQQAQAVQQVVQAPAPTLDAPK